VVDGRRAHGMTAHEIADLEHIPLASAQFPDPAAY